LQHLKVYVRILNDLGQPVLTIVLLLFTWSFSIFCFTSEAFLPWSSFINLSEYLSYWICNAALRTRISFLFASWVLQVVFYGYSNLVIIARRVPSSWYILKRCKVSPTILNPYFELKNVFLLLSLVSSCLIVPTCLKGYELGHHFVERLIGRRWW